MMTPKADDPILIAYQQASQEYETARREAREARRRATEASDKMWALAAQMVRKGYVVNLPL